MLPVEPQCGGCGNVIHIYLRMKQLYTRLAGKQKPRKGEPNVNFLKLRGYYKALSFDGRSSRTERLPNTREAPGLFLESPLPDITWGSHPFSKQKAGSGYSRYYSTIPGEHRTLIDVGSGCGVYVL